MEQIRSALDANGLEHLLKVVGVRDAVWLSFIVVAGKKRVEELFGRHQVAIAEEKDQDIRLYYSRALERMGW